MIKFYKEARRAVCLSNEEDDARAKRDGSRASQAMERLPSMKTMEVKSRTRGGARCCICFDPLSIQTVSVAVFFCCHAYHMTCLLDSTYTNSMKKETGKTSGKVVMNYEYDNIYEDDDDDDDEDDKSGGPRLRCILCTTAAS